jgi:hypothetical protein
MRELAPSRSREYAYPGIDLADCVTDHGGGTLMDRDAPVSTTVFSGPYAVAVVLKALLEAADIDVTVDGKASVPSDEAQSSAHYSRGGEIPVRLAVSSAEADDARQLVNAWLRRSAQ